jgi:mono/diheme cytochrome c family protein
MWLFSWSKYAVRAAVICWFVNLLLLPGLCGGGNQQTPEEQDAPTINRDVQPFQQAERRSRAAERYQHYCRKCHTFDGSGSHGRGVYPEIPDFRHVSWQRGKSDARLLSSILDGKNEGMPAFAGKLSKAEALALVTKVRAFAPAVRLTPSQEKDFEKEFAKLMQELKRLSKEVRQLAAPPHKVVDEVHERPQR